MTVQDMVFALKISNAIAMRDGKVMTVRLLNVHMDARTVSAFLLTNVSAMKVLRDSHVPNLPLVPLVATIAVTATKDCEHVIARLVGLLQIA